MTAGSGCATLAKMHPWAILQSLVLIALANGAPVFAKKIFGSRFARSLDGGTTLGDGRPLFGPSKTIRGFVASLLVTIAGAPLVGLAPALGARAAAAAMAGDLLSSFLKRRLGRPSSSRALGLDQIPEALLPLLACSTALALSAVDIAVGVILFFAGELLVSRLLYRLRLRDQPY